MFKVRSNGVVVCCYGGVYQRINVFIFWYRNGCIGFKLWWEFVDRGNFYLNGQSYDMDIVRYYCS